MNKRLAFIRSMAPFSIPATIALQAMRLLQIRPMAGPTILNRPCQICVCVCKAGRKAPPEPSSWFYKSSIGDGVILTVCDFHCARVVRTHMSPILSQEAAA